VSLSSLCKADEPEAAPKYSILEIERRWLVAPDRVGSLDKLPHRKIDDLYLTGGRLRLRRVETDAGEVAYKLGKKYGKRDGVSEPVATLYLTLEEYRVFAALAGRRASKTRYDLAGGSLDVYSSPQPGLTVFEVEFETAEDARSYQPPHFVRDEITGNPRFCGAALAETGAAPLRSSAPDPGG